MPFRSLSTGPIRTFPGGLLAVVCLATFVSCSDDSMCSSGDYAVETSTLDSARWIMRTEDTLVRGRVSGGDEKRISNWLDGGWYAWPSRPQVRPYLSELTGTLRVGGRLGMADTSVFYELDSLGVLDGDGRSAAVRMEFRSGVGSAYSYYGSYSYGAISDSNSTFWIVRGSVECTLPIDRDLGDASGFTCVIDAKGDDSTAFHLSIQVRKERPEYSCNSNTVS